MSCSSAGLPMTLLPLPPSATASSYASLAAVTSTGLSTDLRCRKPHESNRKRISAVMAGSAAPATAAGGMSHERFCPARQSGVRVSSAAAGGRSHVSSADCTKLTRAALSPDSSATVSGCRMAVCGRPKCVRMRRSRCVGRRAWLGSLQCDSHSCPLLNRIVSVRRCRVVDVHGMTPCRQPVGISRMMTMSPAVGVRLTNPSGTCVQSQLSQPGGPASPRSLAASHPLSYWVASAAGEKTRVASRQ